MALLAARRRKALIPHMCLIALVAVLGLIVAAPADAQQATHMRIDIDESFVSDFLTEACGTTVVISEEGTLNVTLVYNEQGLIVKEIDSPGVGKFTFSAPLTGNSFSFPLFQPAIIDYGAGAEVGSTFTANFVGLFGHVPGLIASDAGLLIISGVVTGFDELGIPLLDFREVLVEQGNRENPEEVVAAICAALTA